MLKGVDVARYQGIINWDALKAAKDFAIIKATGGCPDPGESDSKYLDSSFTRNRDEARRVGILRGFYHYAYPEYNSPEAEAKYFARVMSDLQAGEMVVLDYESSWTGNAVDFCLRWLRTVESILGVKPVIYLNLYTTKSHDWSPVIKNDNGLWLAQWTYKDDGAYDASNPWPMGAALHQYSNRERVSGIPADVDGDVFLGNADAFKKYGKKIFVPIPVPEPTTTTTTTQAPTTTTTTTVIPTPMPEPEPTTTTTTTTTVCPDPTPAPTPDQSGIITRDIILRALKTFIQAFLAAWTVTQFDFSKSVILGAVAAGISAVMNLINPPIPPKQ